MAARSNLIPASSPAAQLTSESQQPNDDRFSYEAPPQATHPPIVACIRRYLFCAFLTVVFLGTGAWIATDWISLDHSRHAKKDSTGLPAGLIPLIKLLSVPVVSLLFTWFHVWLALQMMFFPISFWGIPSRPIVPKCLGLPINGWQGIVPRKAGIMARRACEQMIGNIVTIEEFFDKINPDDFFEQLAQLMSDLTSKVIEQIMLDRFPSIWKALPANVQEELNLKVFDDTKQSFRDTMLEFRTKVSSIIDLKEMAIDAFVARPRMMVDMFRDVALNELQFIQRVAALMGFLLGVVQLGLYLLLQDKPGMDYIMLPLSGLIIGYFTNWLALTMTFKPVWPHKLCGDRVIIQGVFLRRQREASEKLAELICKNVVDAHAMVEYLLRSPSSTSVDKVQEIYRTHVDRTVERSVGLAGKIAPMAPAMIGSHIACLKKDVERFSLALLQEHKKKFEDYLDKKMDVEATLSWRLSRIRPPEFENIIHPIFQDDEWILLLVGAVLGVIIGLLQAWALQVIK